MTGPYDVGYGKPPLSGQFKKGQSGNAGGRKRGSKNLATMVKDALHQKVVVAIDGKSVKLTKLEASLIQQANKAAKGDAKAMKQMVELLLTTETREAEQNGGDQESITQAARERHLLVIAALREHLVKGGDDDQTG